MRSFVAWLVTVPTILAASCTPGGDAGEMSPDPEAVGREIAESFDAYASAAMDGDVDAMLEHLTDDARFMEPGLTATGEELRSTMRGMLAEAELTRFEFQRVDLFVHDGAAYEIGTYEEVIETPDGETVVEGNVFVRWEQGEDGRWRIDRVVAGPRNAP